MIRARLVLARLAARLLPKVVHAAVARLKPWAAQRLRFAADRMDPDGAFRATGFAFTFEPGLGIVFREAVAGGTRIWYRGPDYKRAHDDAGGVLPARSWLPGGRPTL